MSEPKGPTPAAERPAAATAGTPAASAPKAAPKAPAAAKAGKADADQPIDTEHGRRRRRFIWACVAGYLVANFLMFLRFFLPRTLFEPKTQFPIGFPSDFGLGVDTRFQKDHRIWVVRNPERLFVIFAVCTHLGCTPDWKSGENKFKCPCHGSGYDNEGVNFEGPAPRPMDRAHVELDPQGRILVDVGRLYRWPKGMASQFNEPGSFIQV